MQPTLPTNSIFFFFNDTATTEIYTLSLHDALPILAGVVLAMVCLTIYFDFIAIVGGFLVAKIHLTIPIQVYLEEIDRKSTRLNSSHGYISYAVFCLKKKNSETRAAEERNKPVVSIG